MGDTNPPQFGQDIDTQAVADAFEEYAERLRNHEGYLQAISAEHRTRVDEYDKVEVSFEYAPCESDEGMIVWTAKTNNSE